MAFGAVGCLGGAAADAADVGDAAATAARAAAAPKDWPALICACDVAGAVRPPRLHRSAAPCRRWQTSPFSTSPATLLVDDMTHPFCHARDAEQ